MAGDTSSQPQLTDRQLRVVDEIQRVARMLGVNKLSQSDFDKHHQLAGCSTAGYQFGSWNAAVRAAGLEPYEVGQSNVGPEFTDDELLQEIIRLAHEVGKRPSMNQMATRGQFSPKPYKARWGSWLAACDAAYACYGDPNDNGAQV